MLRLVALSVALGCVASEARADGPYVANEPHAFEGRVLGDGYCVRFVQAAAGAPRATEWQAGAVVPGNVEVPFGTAIATFEVDGTYTSETGNHAEIYVGQDATGLWVYDQWKGQPVHKRLIRFAGGRGSDQGSKSNNGKLYRVIN